MTCTKTTLIKKIIDKNNLSPSEANQPVETLLEIIKSTLASGEDIMLSGFGKFQTNEKSPRKGRNPATDGSITLDKRRIVSFKCAGGLKDKINGKK